MDLENFRESFFKKTCVSCTGNTNSGTFFCYHMSENDYCNHYRKALDTIRRIEYEEEQRVEGKSF